MIGDSWVTLLQKPLKASCLKISIMMSLLHVVITVAFGLFFVQTILREPAALYGSPIWWHNVLWSLVAIGMGSFIAIYTNRFIADCKRYFEWLYRKTGFPLFKLQADSTQKPYMRVFYRFFGIMFAVIGATLLLHNFNIL